jgi:hypothetical protein
MRKTIGECLGFSARPESFTKRDAAQPRSERLPHGWGCHLPGNDQATRRLGSTGRVSVLKPRPYRSTPAVAIAASTSGVFVGDGQRMGSLHSWFTHLHAWFKFRFDREGARHQAYLLSLVQKLDGLCPVLFL